MSVFDTLKRSYDPLKELKELDKPLLDELVAEYGSASQLARALGVSDREVRRIVTPDTKYTKRDDCLANQMQEYLQRKRGEKVTIEELSNKFDRSYSTIGKTLEEIKSLGYVVDDIDLDSVSLRADKLPRKTEHFIKFDQKEYCIGVISDTHYGSTYNDEEFINSAYDYFKKSGAAFVLNCGDVTEGPGIRGYHGHHNDVYPWAQERQSLEEYVNKNYPKGIDTYLISGMAHDQWEYMKSGIDIIDNICNGRGGKFPLQNREDLHYLGQQVGDVYIGSKVKVRLFHPGDGSSYAVSYKLQKFVESFPGGDKPNILLVGHYHQACYTTIRNVAAYLVPGCQWATPFFMKYGKEPVVGAYILHIRLDDNESLRSIHTETLYHYFEKGI